MIEYYIDGSTKNNIIGAGIVKINEFGFIEKHHFNVEHINPTATIAEGFSLESTFKMIKEIDLQKNELIDIYSDCQRIYHSFMYNSTSEFNRSSFFIKQESDRYLNHLRSLYIDLISRHSDYPLFFCDRTREARPIIRIFFKEDAKDKKYLQDAHTLSRNYLKDDQFKPVKMELKAIKKDGKWVIIKNNKGTVAENKRPLIALSEALKDIDTNNTQIKLCDTLETFLKNTNKNQLANEPMKSAIKIIENHKLLVSL